MTRYIEPVIGFEIELPKRGSRILTRSVYRQIREHILSGRLKPGLLMPSSRQLAAAFGISRNTAIAVYDWLAGEGCVVTRAGGGTYVTAVAPHQRASSAAPIKQFDAQTRPLWRRAAAFAPVLEPKRIPFDFSVGIPSVETFPFDIWRRLYGRAVRAMARRPALYGEPQGQRALRSAVAQHVSFTRAVSCTEDDVLICAGAQQAFDLIAKVLVTPGKTTVAVEDPGYPPLHTALKAAGALIVPVRVDLEGIVVEDIPRSARLICVTPSHQFPLGVAMSAARRKDLLECAYRQRAIIVEDDYDGEFRHGPRSIDALQTMDRRHSVFYVGTFSKSMFPELRIGYIVSPAWARSALRTAKMATDWHSATLPQDALADFIVDGHLARHVRKTRRLYTERWATVNAAIAQHLSGIVEVLPATAGLHVAGRTTSGQTARKVARIAEHTGLWLADLRQFAVGRPYVHGVVLGFGRIPAARIAKGIEALGNQCQ